MEILKIESRRRPPSIDRPMGHLDRWAYWRCVCGKEKWTKLAKLKSGAIKSCGCLPRHKFDITHGMSYSSEYQTWGHMIERCTNPKNHKWAIYGGRGIRVCERWLKFENFYADMGPRPKGLTIDRMDNDGNYEPGNCRWATNDEQKMNRRNTLWVKIGGREKLLSDTARELGLSYGVAAYRLGFTSRVPKKRSMMHLLDNFP